MRILLTGGSGFVGRNIREQLGKKYEILSPSHNELELLDETQVQNFIKKKKIKIIIHAAIKGGDNVLEHTIRMFLNLLRNVDKVDKFIHFGSGAEYGKTRDLKKIQELGIGSCIPKDLYGLAKYACHTIGTHKKKVVNLRLFGIYGKYEGYLYKFISNSIVKNIFSLPIKIKQNVLFDYLYIDDLIPVVDYFLQHKAVFTDYNVTPESSISLLEIAQIISKIGRKKPEIVIVNKKLNFQYTGSNSRLKREIKKIKFTSYENGITQLYDYYFQNRKKLDKRAVIDDNYFTKSKIRV